MAGITESGFVAKTFDEILASFDSAGKTSIDARMPDPRLKPTSKWGMISRACAYGLSELWKATASVHLMWDPRTARGIYCDIIGTLRGIPRIVARRATLYLQVVPAVDVPIGGTTWKKTGTDGPLYTNTAIIPAGGEGGYGSKFICSSDGIYPIENSDTFEFVTGIECTFVGIVAYSQDPGAVDEKDDDYMIRQETLGMQRPNVNSYPALAKALSEVPGVRTFSWEHYSGRIEISVEGTATDKAVATAIFNHTGAGIYTYGTTNYDVSYPRDPLNPLFYNFSEHIKWTKVTTQNLSLSGNIYTIRSITAQEETDIKAYVDAEILNWYYTKGPGEVVTLAGIVKIIMTHPLVFDASSITIDSVASNKTVDAGKVPRAGTNTWLFP
jgi:uncharacterized phage protein gp47/JayE